MEAGRWGAGHGPAGSAIRSGGAATATGGAWRKIGGSRPRSAPRTGQDRVAGLLRPTRGVPGPQGVDQGIQRRQRWTRKTMILLQTPELVGNPLGRGRGFRTLRAAWPGGGRLSLHPDPPPGSGGRRSRGMSGRGTNKDAERARQVPLPKSAPDRRCG